MYLAEHLKLKVYRAIKCIPKSSAHNSFLFSEDCILTEANLLKTLNHPGIPLIYDIDEDSDFIYMIEEFIQGESLEDLILHQENISQELIIEYGIQLCDILDYLHHLSPYPILYQDLKPEHIILCGNRIKIVDFGVASFITGSGKKIQFYGTDGYAAKEAIQGQPVSPASDIYSLGKVLSFLASAASPVCSPQLFEIIEKASADLPPDRYQNAADLKKALLLLCEESTRSGHSTDSACWTISHLIRNIAVLGSRPGAGVTHFAISLVSTLNKKGILSVYLSMGETDSLFHLDGSGIFFREENGIFYHRHFAGIPCYGNGVIDPLSVQSIRVRDYNAKCFPLEQSSDYDLIFYILSDSVWDIQKSLALADQLKSHNNVVFICNYSHTRAARKCARYLHTPVYCFPIDEDPFFVTREKERLITQILKRIGGKHYIWNWWKRNKIPYYHWIDRLRRRCRRHSPCHRSGKYLRF